MFYEHFMILYYYRYHGIYLYIPRTTRPVRGQCRGEPRHVLVLRIVYMTALHSGT